MKKRVWVFLLIIGLVSLCGFASGNKEEASTDSTKNMGYDVDNMDFNDVTITIASRYGADVPDEIYFRQKIKEFSDMDNGITVKMDTIPTESDYLNNLRTSFASGDTPNVFMEYGGARTLDYLESNALQNITPYFDQYPEWKANFNPSVWDKLSYEGYDGVWGVPFKMYTVVLYYNTEIFAKEGLEPPKNWDELQTVCAKLMKDGIKPFQVGEKDVWRFGHFSNNLIIKSLGVGAVAKLADRSLAYDSPEIVKTFNMIEDMMKKGYFGEDILSTNYPTEKSVFASEGCAMRWDGSWYVSEIFGTPIYKKTGVVAFPYVNETYKNHSQGGANDMWFISSLNKNKDEIDASVALVRYLTSSEYIAANNEVAANIFPINFTPTAATPDNPLLDDVQKIANSMVEMRDDIQTYDSQSHMLDTVRAALQGIAMGNSGEECAEEIVNRIKQSN
jgi:ABC-type glycerol-3-phosphate transport system substrate-binding protein